jgi:uncharacterized protein Veg
MTTFKNTIEHHNGTTLEVVEYTGRKEAKKGQRVLIKKYDMERHAGHTVNYSEHTELYTNY